MTTVPLSRPIQAHGEERRALELREPTGADIIACGGNPASGGTNVNGDVVIINPHVVAAYIGRLGSIPPSSINQLCPHDWMRLQAAILDFFREPESDETMTDSSTDTSTSAGSGNGRRARSLTSPSAS